MTRWILGLIVAAGIASAARVEAITVDEVKGLARAGASDSIILAKIDADSTVFNLTVDEILDLRTAGVSDRVITYMINTGKYAPQPAPAAEEQAPAETTQDQGGGGSDQYQTAPDSRYYGSVDVTFGYYYPHWPGYSYTWYYDPFWWPSWSYYWAWWCPYPYYYWYNDPWYCGNAYYYGYYRHCYSPYYPDYGGYWYDGVHRRREGRNIGNRGPVDTAERILKVPSPGDQMRAGQSGAVYRMREPRSSVTPGNPTVIRGGVRIPSQRGTPAVGSAPGRSRTTYRPTPAPAPTRRSSPPSRGGVGRSDPSPSMGSSGGSSSSGRGNDSGHQEQAQQPQRQENRSQQRAEPSRAPTQREEARQSQRQERQTERQSPNRGGTERSSGGRQSKGGGRGGR
jgi:hypothetical protein